MKGVIYGGIDPGNSGAVGWIMPDGTAESHHMPQIVTRRKVNSKLKSGKNKGQKKERTETKIYPDLPGIYKLVQQLALVRSFGYEVRVMLENVTSGPKDGVRQAFSFGYAKALCEMALTALQIPYELVSPGQWRTQVVGKDKTKADSLRLARRLFPQVELPLVKDEARAEALLLAHYYRIREGGGSFSRKAPEPKKKKPKIVYADPAAITVSRRKQPQKGFAKNNAAKPVKPLPTQRELFEVNREYVFGTPPPAPTVKRKQAQDAYDEDKRRHADLSFEERRARWKAQQGKQ